MEFRQQVWRKKVNKKSDQNVAFGVSQRLMSVTWLSWFQRR